MRARRRMTDKEGALTGEIRGGSMLERFYPDRWVDSAYGIPYEDLYEQGIRGIIFDIDNTLVPHGAPADQRALALFGRFRRMGMKTCLLSNNKEPRVKPFAEQVDSLYIHKAGKPGIRTYLTKPIDPREEIQIVLKRYLEKAVLFFYRRRSERENGD